MGRTHYWFATEKDMPQIDAWLAEAGAVPLVGRAGTAGFDTPREFVLHFAQFGPIEYSPGKIEVSGQEGSPEWKRAALVKIRQQMNPGVPLIDVAKSPTASFFGPYRRDGLFWTTAELHFTTPSLEKTFPELGKICARFGKWLAKNELIFDHASRGSANEPFNPFGYNLGIEPGLVRKIYAFPDALAQLKSGAFMIERQMSGDRFDRFKRTLRLRGIEC